MKALELISRLIDLIDEYGNQEVIVDLLTDNQSNLVNITSIDESYGNEKCFYINAEIEDVKQFKKNFK